MHKNDLKARVLKLLTKHEFYRFEEIAEKLSLNNKDKKLLSKVLRELKFDKKIIKNKGKFGFPNEKKKRKKDPTNNDKNLVTGTFDAIPLAKGYSFAFVRTDNFDVFIDKDSIKNAFDGDEVLVRIQKKRKKGPRGRIQKVLKRSNNRIVGNLYLHHNRFYLSPDNKRFYKDIILRDRNLDLNQKVLVQIKDWGGYLDDQLPKGKVLKMLGPADDFEVQKNGILYEYGLDRDFPQKVKKQVSNLNFKIDKTELKKRKDLRNLPTLTIDPISAKDFDDAISLIEHKNSYDLYIHIADVAHFVKPGTPLFKEAMYRANSFYFPKKVIPMLPFELSNKICSLNPDEDKFSITAKFNLSKELEILDFDIFESIICSDLRLNYGEVDNLFANQETEIPRKFKNTLKKMLIISQKLSTNRYKEGYLFFELHDKNFVFNDKGELIDIRRESETQSHKLIENFMLLANTYISKLLSNTSKNTIYRSHELPDKKDMKELKALLKQKNIQVDYDKNFNEFFQKAINCLNPRVYHRILLRFMKQAKYTTKNFGHFALGFSYYTHFTSPIRRCADLIIHSQLKHVKFKRNYKKFAHKELLEISKRASNRERIAADAEKSVKWLYIKRFMQKNLGQEFSGLVVMLKKSRIVIELDRYPVLGAINLSSLKNDYYEFDEKNNQFVGKRTKRKISLSDKVKVTLVKVTDDLYFEFS